MRTFVSDEPDPSEHSAALIQPLSPAGAGLSSERSPAQPSLFIPALAPDVLDRSRIRALMDDAAAPGRLAMLLGPPGTGKTTAAALWARRCERPVVWLDAEESAGDPWEFYADLIDELQRATGTTGLSSIIAGFEQPRPLRRMGPSSRGSCCAEALTLRSSSIMQSCSAMRHWTCGGARRQTLQPQLGPSCGQPGLRLHPHGRDQALRAPSLTPRTWSSPPRRHSPC